MATDEYQNLFDQALAAGYKRNYLQASNLLLRIVSETESIPQAYLYLGRSYQALGNLDLAIQFLRYFVDRKPTSGAGHFFLGRGYLAKGLPLQAAHELEKASEIDPNNGHVLALQGIAQLRSHRSDLAVTCLAQAVEIDPNNSELYVGYLNTLLVEAIRTFRDRDFDLSHQMFSFLLEAGHKSSLPFLYLANIERKRGNYHEALKWYNKASLSYKNDPLIHLQRADVLHRIGRQKDATEILQTFGFAADDESIDWNSDDLNRFIAIESFQKGHLKKARHHAKRVIKQSGPDYEMHVLMGEASRMLERYQSAENHFERAHAIKKERIEPLYGLAMIHWNLGRWEQMLSELARIEHLDAGNTIAAYYVALCRCKLKHSPSETIPAIQEALRKNSPDQFLMCALGDEYLKDARADLAEKWYKKTLELVNDFQPAFQGLIQTYKELEDAYEQRESLYKYIKMYPEDADSRKHYISLLVNEKKYEDAVEQIQIALSFESDVSELTRLLAFCYRRTNRYREAAVAYRQLLKEEPESEQYLRALCFSLEMSGNRKTSVELLEKAFRFLTPSNDLRLIFGVLLYRENRLEEALSEFRLVTAENDQDWRAYKNIAIIYRERGLHDLAERFFSQAENRRQSGGIVDKLSSGQSEGG
ncbi:MAG: hypothetical protein CMN78_01435 [Spirochaetales bacterium]|nr:hypothetical protein [Spirochaetales bacterium]